MRKGLCDQWYLCVCGCVCVCVCVCVTKKCPFTRLPGKRLHKKDAYSSLIHFLCRQRYELDLLSHTENAKYLVYLEIVTATFCLDKLADKAGRANPNITPTYQWIEIAVLHEISLVQQSTDSAHNTQGVCSVELEL